MNRRRFQPAAVVPLLAPLAARRYVALVSGGRDSVALMHALASVRRQLPAPLVVLHFDHGIAADSGAWQAFTRAQAGALGLPFFSERLSVGRGGALETRARAARYRRLAEWMREGDCCISAHHADDQAETFLLQALRGCGPAGLAAMPATASFGPGWLVRPLLQWTRSELAAWAAERDLHWVQDPGNLDLAAPRNWLRARVWPPIAARWPAAAHTLSRSAQLAAEAASVLEEIAGEDLGRIAAPGADRLPVAALLTLRAARRRNLLRAWLRARGVPLPSATTLAAIEHDYVMHDPGAKARLGWPGGEVRRFRNMLHALVPLPEPPLAPVALVPGRFADLGDIGSAGLVRRPQGRLGPAVAGAALELRFRTGGERVRLPGADHRRALKKLLQEAGILPWMRGRLPLLFVDGELAAVPGVAVAERFAGTGWEFVWKRAPAVR